MVYILDWLYITDADHSLTQLMCSIWSFMTNWLGLVLRSKEKIRHKMCSTHHNKLLVVVGSREPIQEHLDRGHGLPASCWKAPLSIVRRLIRTDADCWRRRRPAAAPAGSRGWARWWASGGVPPASAVRRGRSTSCPAPRRGWRGRSTWCPSAGMGSAPH